jgi:AcrR family transcriptional regulator
MGAVGYPGVVPKAVDHEERRASIVAAAQRTIGAGGLDGATMRKIAQAASCTTGLLSHYFDSRDQILIAALKAAHRAAGQRMMVVAAEADPVRALRNVLLEALPLDDLRRGEWLVWIAFWSQAVHSDPMREEHVSRYREWLALLAELLLKAEGNRTGGPDPVDEAFRLSALVDGLGLQITLRRGGGDAERVIGTIDHHLETLGLRAGGEWPADRHRGMPDAASRPGADSR